MARWCVQILLRYVFTSLHYSAVLVFPRKHRRYLRSQLLAAQQPIQVLYQVRKLKENPSHTVNRSCPCGFIRFADLNASEPKKKYSGFVIAADARVNLAEWKGVIYGARWCGRVSRKNCYVLLSVVLIHAVFTRGDYSWCCIYIRQLIIAYIA